MTAVAAVLIAIAIALFRWQGRPVPLWLFAAAAGLLLYETVRLIRRLYAASDDR